MANENSGLHTAKRNKKDEFYTQIADIENELRHYRSHFKDKVVYCNCDDPYVSAFFEYFTKNFEFFGLKRLITTCYKSQRVDLFSQGDSEHAIKLEYTGGAPNSLPTPHDIGVTPLQGDGDFRSQECIDILKEADIVVTNPPFSLFREYVAQLAEHDKKFLIIGNVNAVTYKEVFRLIQQNKLWFGPSIRSGDREFGVPDEYPLNAAGFRIDGEGKKYIRVKGVRWFTNMDFKERHEDLILYKTYSPTEYPTYHNYEAIEVGKTRDIPADYDGAMGVPITFLDKHNPEQFEILGSSSNLGEPMSKVAKKGTYSPGGPRFYISNGDGTYCRMYDRIVIKNKKLGE